MGLESAVIKNLGVDAICPTSGPASILSAKKKIPYQLINFGVDCAHGVKEEPTSIEDLEANMNK